MIIETIVSTLDSHGETNLSPVGAIVRPDSWERFEFRLFPESQTLANLLETREGVLHLTDDAMLFARAIADQWDGLPPMESSDRVQARRLSGVSAAHEFRVTQTEQNGQRIFLQCETVATHHGTGFRGFNRARYAIVEAAILVSRLGILPDEEIHRHLDPLGIIVKKTGGPDELAAWQLLAERFSREASR